MKKKVKPSEMDFDAWMALAQDDPDGFEAMRRAAIDEVIERAPEASRVRLRSLQWRIDQERRLARTPLKACIRISNMMWRNVMGPGGLHERFVELHGMLGGDSEPRPRRARVPAEVVAFARAGD
jgi:hypothetical protein